MRILFVALANGLHTARWIAQLEGTGWDIHLYHAEWPAALHPALRHVTVHGADLWRPAGLDPSVRLAGQWPFRGAFRAQNFLLRRFPVLLHPPRRLARTIRALEPDIVHSLEMQRGAYLTLRARDQLGSRFPKWIYSCWGNDVYWFQHRPEHLPQIRNVLAHCGYLAADCQRDLDLARAHGFRGVSLGVFPGPGGFPVDAMRERVAPGPPSSRRVLAIKGTQDETWGRRGLFALAAVHRCADLLRDCEIAVYSATPAVAAVVGHMARTAGLRIACIPPSPHDEIVRLLGRSRIALAISKSDGTPNAMLEAMIMGAFPVQSDTVSTGEWIRDGENGLLVPPEDVDAIERALRRALTDDALVDSAAPINLRIARQRLDMSVVRPAVLAMYERVAADPRPRATV